MSDEIEDQDDDDDQDGHAQLPRKDLRNLRQAAKERDSLAAQLEARDRELAFAKANLDLADPKVGYFIKGYDGDLTPEAIRAKAESDGFLTPPSDPQNREAMEAQRRIARASSGAGETPNPELGDLIRACNTQEEVMKVMIQAGYPTSWNRVTDE